MRHVLTLVDGRVLAIGLLLFGATLAAAVAVWRRNGPAMAVLVATAGSVLILLLTIVNRGVVVSGAGLEHDVTWWARNWSALPNLITGDPGWWFNVALFVPAAIGWTRLLRRPGRVLIALIVASLVIETLQAMFLSGAGDPTDVVANALGALIGVAASGKLSAWSTVVSPSQP